MSPKKVVFSNPMAEVVMEPVIVAGKDTGKYAVMVQDDDGEFQHQAMNSKDYRLLKNSLALQVGEDMMSRSPYQWDRIPKLNVWNGRFMSLSYMTTDLRHEITSVGDVISLGLRLENSYDGSCKFRASLMAFVLSCTNGMVAPRFFESYTFRHLEGSEDFDVSDISDKLQSGAEVLNRVAPLIDRLGSTPLSTQLITTAAQKLSLPGNNFMRVLKGLDSEISRPKTAWDFMQGMTYQATHEIPGKAGLKHSEEIGDFFLNFAF